MLGWDKRFEAWTVGHRVSALDPIFRWLTYIGTDGAVWLVLAVVLALRSRRGQVILWVLLADIVAQSTTAAIKAVVARDRPHGHAIVAEPSSHSFPSGHAASSFACATVLAAFAPTLRWPLFILAAAIAWSRVYVGVHFPLDVLAGAAWGLAIGIVILRLRALLGTRIRRRTPAQSADDRAPSSS
jgi:undecaprenyl-diphosphatase